MRKTLITALIAAVALPAMTVPTIASAQNREVRRERADLREERRELRQARRYGDGRDVRRERRDVRNARRDLNEERREQRWGRNDWREYRGRNRALYARGNWRAPFRYTQFRAGSRIAPSYYGQRYWIGNPGRYRLPPVGRNQHWVRHYNDVILIDTRRGYVVDVIRGFYW